MANFPDVWLSQPIQLPPDLSGRLDFPYVCPNGLNSAIPSGLCLTTVTCATYAESTLSVAVAETYLPASVCLDPAGRIEAKLRVLILDEFDFEHLFQFAEFGFELPNTAVVER